MSQPSKTDAVVIDANVLISLCTKKPLTFAQASTAFNDYGQRGWAYYAPNVIVSETLFVLCQKLQPRMQAVNDLPKFNRRYATKKAHKNYCFLVTAC